MDLETKTLGITNGKTDLGDANTKTDGLLASSNLLKSLKAKVNFQELLTVESSGMVKVSPRTGTSAWSLQHSKESRLSHVKDRPS